MEQKLVGRNQELKILNEYLASDRSEFIAVYGRSLLLTLITSFGLKENKHNDIVQKQITMDELFA